VKFFVTGATGFIGGRVIRQLVNEGHQVHALVHTSSKSSELARLGIRPYEGDITSRDSLRAPMTGVDGVFHIAAWYKIGARDSGRAAKVNIEGTRNVLELMAELKIPKGVYTSTLAVFSDTQGKLADETYRHTGTWLSEYDRTKWVAHYEVALPMIQKGLPLVIVQPGVVYGPGDTSAIEEAFVQYLKRRLPLTPGRTAFC
jgi:nucleoside-diphosphate-sugar epimerase